MMDDLISRDAAIDDIKSRDPSKIWDIVDIEEWVDALPSVQSEHATCYLDSPCEYQNPDAKLPFVQPEQRWIPCERELPESNGDYLVTGRHGAVNKRRFEDGRWYGGWAILAWMPLPEPYKEGKA